MELFPIPSSEVCPVGTLSRFLLLREGQDGPLLQHADGSALSRFQFVAVFHRCLGELGLRPTEYASHSFRIGATTEVARWGLSDSVVRWIGRRESVRYWLYVCPHLL